MRLDLALVARGLAETRSRAQALVKAGVVTVDGAAATRPSQEVGDEAALAVAEDPCPWVSRGALKLLAALDAFALSPAGAVALDCGASTGGFTEVLLARGAARVYAVDVGRDQMAPRLRADPRVVSLEGVNLKALDAGLVPAAPSFLTADLSFISLAKALPAALALAAPKATLVALVKPQFEVGRARVGKGGVVRDAVARAEAVEAVLAFLASAGWPTLGVVQSPIQGGDGNVEFLLAAQRDCG